MAYITRINLALWYPSNQYEVNPNISREQILSRQELVKIHSKDRQLTLMSIEVLLSDLLFDRSYLNIVLEIPFALAIWLINTNLFQLMTIKTIQRVRYEHHFATLGCVICGIFDSVQKVENWRQILHVRSTIETISDLKVLQGCKSISLQTVGNSKKAKVMF